MKTILILRHSETQFNPPIVIHFKEQLISPPPNTLFFYFFIFAGLGIYIYIFTIYIVQNYNVYLI